MNTYIPRFPATALVYQVGSWLHDAARALWRVAERLDARLAATANESDDGRALATMSDHELRDIGVSRDAFKFGNSRDRLEMSTVVWP
jgi:uncharacterized protein YjiS (DUF1127 family)